MRVAVNAGSSECGKQWMVDGCAVEGGDKSVVCRSRPTVATLVTLGAHVFICAAGSGHPAARIAVCACAGSGA